MAYPSPNYYPPYYQPVYQQPQMPQQAQYSQQSQPSNQMPIQNQNQQIQNGGLVSVHNVEEAKNYPVMYGTSVMFKDESQPNVIYTKTMGFNQLDRPTFEKYRLVKEDSQNIDENTPKIEDNAKDGNDTKYALKSDLDAIWSEIEALKEKCKVNTPKKIKRVVEVEADGDDE